MLANASQLFNRRCSASCDYRRNAVPNPMLAIQGQSELPFSKSPAEYSFFIMLSKNVYR